MPFEFSYPGSFYAEESEDPVKVEMMNKTSKLQFMQNDQLMLVDIPYASSNKRAKIAMTLILPKQRYGLETLESDLSAEFLDRHIAEFDSRLVKLSLPKWHVEKTIALREALSEMGIGPLFTDDADFSGISESNALRMSSVLHKTFIDVDEIGTEAGAMTAVDQPCGGPPDMVSVTANHPFLYLIRDTKSGAILFIGRVVEPSRRS